MANSSFRDRVLTPPVARAIMSPLGIALFGVGAAGAILVGAPLVAAAGVGALAWGGQVLARVPRNPSATRVEPFALADPWRSYVVGAKVAKTRFDGVVGDMDRGPLRDRLAGLAERLDDGIDESWRIAKRGNDISIALSRLDTRQAERELEQIGTEAAGDAGSQSELARALEAQIASARRLQTIAADAQTRLRLLDARFDELVARAIEVSVGTGDSDVLGADVNGLVLELESLRVALEETQEAESEQLPKMPPPATLPPTTPPTTEQSG
jgi:hypothetical protein